MKTLNRVIKVRLSSGNDVSSNYPVTRYDNVQEAIANHGESEVLEAFHYVQDMRAASQERFALLASIREAEKNA